VFLPELSGAGIREALSESRPGKCLANGAVGGGRNSYGFGEGPRVGIPERGVGGGASTVIEESVEACGATFKMRSCSKGSAKGSLCLSEARFLTGLELRFAGP
jgi:hypothetical protein